MHHIHPTCHALIPRARKRWPGLGQELGEAARRRAQGEGDCQEVQGRTEEAEVRELAIHRRVIRFRYSCRCAEASVVARSFDAGYYGKLLQKAWEGHLLYFQADKCAFLRLDFTTKVHE